MGKVKPFLALSRQQKMILCESYFYLGWARVLKSFPFHKVAPYLGEQMQETPLLPGLTNKQQLRDISGAIQLASRYTFWESECLVKAIAGMKMLERRKIACTLYLGTAKEDSGRFIAHAWLRSGPFYITGEEGMERFTVVGKFANKGARHD